MRHSIKYFQITVVLFASLMFANVAQGQSTATLAGTVSDTTGAVVAGAPPNSDVHESKLPAASFEAIAEFNGS